MGKNNKTSTGESCLHTVADKAWIFDERHLMPQFFSINLIPKTAFGQDAISLFAFSLLKEKPGEPGCS